VLSLGVGKASASKGFTARVTLSAAGQVDLMLYRIVRRHGHTKSVLQGVMKEPGKQGTNAFVIRKVHHHSLKPGSYKLVAYGVSGTVKSKAKTRSFSVRR
jgi:hypothetical protein